MRRWIPAFLIAADLVFAAAVYQMLPDRLPVHWGLDGQPNGWASRVVAAFVLPAFTLVLWGVLAGVPSIDPRNRNISKFRPSYDITVIAAVGFLVAVHVATLGLALGWPIRIDTIIALAVGLLFIVIGNFLPRSRSNFTFGIRTPWALTDDRVWARSNRVGGYLMVGAGIACVAGAFLPGTWPVVVIGGATVVAVVGSVAYSYVTWSRGGRGGAR